MSLSPRQVALYGHRVIVWRKTESLGGDGKPSADTWALTASGAAVATTVTTGASSATQTVGSTTGMAAGDVLFFVGAQAERTISSVASATSVVLTATISTTTAEKVALTVPCYANIGKSQQGPSGGIIVVENDNLFTYDEFSFEDTVSVQIGDVIRMTYGPEPGKFWTVRGEAQIKNRRANKLLLMCSRAPKAPNGVS